MNSGSPTSDHEADRVALAEYQLAVQSAEQRVQRLTIALTEAAQVWRFEPVVAALRALRGIDGKNPHTDYRSPRLAMHTPGGC